MILSNVLRWMVTLTTLFFYCTLDAIIVRVAKWDYEGKIIMLYYDIHRLPGFEEQEKHELESFNAILESQSKLLKAPTRIQVEHIEGTPTQTGLLFNLDNDLSLDNVSVQNIEIRCASEAARLLLKYGPNRFKLDHQISSAYKNVLIHSVTFNDVLVEWNTTKNFLDIAYLSYNCARLQQVYNCMLSVYDQLYKEVTTHLKNLLIPNDSTIASLIYNASIDPSSHSLLNLQKLILQLDNQLFDMHLLFSILTVKQPCQIAVIVGADHANSINGILMSNLRAKKICSYGPHICEIPEESLQTGKGITPIEPTQLDLFEKVSL